LKRIDESFLQLFPEEDRKRAKELREEGYN
jgi:hypothetical protein